jgi:hypothetical protein
MLTQGHKGFHKRMVGFKASTEENLFRKKKSFILQEKHKTFTWAVWHLIDLNVGTMCHSTSA